MTSSEAGRPSRVAITEGRILAAARELFIAQGYPDTTLSAVADRAGVGARTVYLRFGSKGTVLLRAAEQSLGVAPGAEGTPDPVGAFARQCRLRYEGLGGLVGVLAQAAATEPFVADAVAQSRAANRRAAAELVRTLRAGGQRVHGIDPEQAGETVGVLGAADTWLLLTESAGWDPDRYETWLADTIRLLFDG